MVMENKKRHEKKKERQTGSLESLIKSDNEESVQTYKSLNWTGTFWDYVEMLKKIQRLLEIHIKDFMTWLCHMV